MTAATTEYIASFNLKEDRLGRLCVRAMAKILLASIEGNTPSKYEIRKRTAGDVFSPQSSLCLSFSHTKTHAAVAISLDKCGIDIENNGRILDREKISKRFFSSEEHERVLLDPDAFFKIWTAKEAFLKHEGTGIDRPLKEIRVSANNKKVRYKDDGFALHTHLKMDLKHTTTLSIVGAANCREIQILDLLKR